MLGGSGLTARSIETRTGIMDTATATDEVRPLPSMDRLVELMIDAARMGRDDMIPALLQAGVDVNAHDAKGYTPLIIATYNGQESTTALLIAAGADLDGADGAKGNTALMGVAFKGYASIATMVVDAGADVNKVNDAGQTALMMAALFDQTAIIDTLLSAGADPDLCDAAGNSARSMAESQGNAALVSRLATAAR
jgi:ankyrin repeat protein